MANTNGTIDIYILYGSSIANYFNRRVLFYSSLADYLSNAEAYELKEDINFNPADGVRTTLDVLTDYGDKFTYLLAVDSETSEILSRWFILEADRNLAGQYRFQLKRDVVAESILNNEFVLNAPIYVEKAILQDGDPLIVNSEGMSFNQIKQNEILLDDFANLQFVDWGYIIGYFESGATTTSTLTVDQNTTMTTTISAAYISNQTGIPLDKVNLLLGGSTIPFTASNLTLTVGIDNPLPGYNAIKYELNDNDLNKIESANIVDFINETVVYFPFDLDMNTVALAAMKLGADFISYSSEQDIISDINVALNNDIAGEVLLTREQYNKLSLLIGSIISIGGQLYSIDGLQSEGIVDHSEIVISKNETSFFNSLATTIAGSTGEEQDSWNMFLNYKIQNVKLTLNPYSETSSSVYKITIPATARKLKDAPYSMFMIPYGNNVKIDVGTNGTSDVKLLSKEAALRIATELAIKLQDKLYDLQLLPYAPTLEYGVWWNQLYGAYIPLMLYRQNFIDDIGGDPVDHTFTYITDSNDDNISAIFFPETSNISRTIDLQLTAQDNPKIESQCNFYRLCSPNYSGVFEFNLAKNGQSVEAFLLEATYKPYNPLIRIQPQFKGLYGASFVDGRGLICGGDFSLPLIRDQWETYQQNNKNFANIFARDIQNLDVAQRQEGFKETINIASGIVGAGAAGAAAGAKLGGVYGAIAGGVAGTALGSVGGAMDARLGAERRAEAKDYMIDRFNMNLANIKALPQTLARNSSFTTINKIFPFLEYYTCTQEEKQALQNKITYDGMTVGRIDTMINYLSPSQNGTYYFKGQLIRASGIQEDNHYINALYEELAKGVYI